MNNWYKLRLEWAGIPSFQLAVPLFLFYRIAGAFGLSYGENDDGWSVRVQNDVASLAMLASICRFAPSPTIHRTFCGSNW